MSKHYPKGQENYLQIKRYRTFFYVLNVKNNLFLGAEVVSAVDLCPAGKSGLYVVRTVLVALLDQIVLIPKSRTRTDNAHTSAEDIEELGKLVKAGLAQKSAHLGDPALRVVQLVCRRVVRSVGAHCAELEDVEVLFVNSHALLLKKYRSLAVALDRDSDNDHRQGQKNYTEKGQKYINNSLKKLLIHNFLL